MNGNTKKILLDSVKDLNKLTQLNIYFLEVNLKSKNILILGKNNKNNQIGGKNVKLISEGYNKEGMRFARILEVLLINLRELKDQ